MLKSHSYMTKTSIDLKTLKHFNSSFVVSIIGLVIGVFCYPEHPIAIVISIAILAMLEISLSFDNAIINAKVLSQMPVFWQKMFMLIGMPIAVFGMRLVFPILLVSISSDISFYHVIELAVYHPSQYEHTLETSMPYICSFGGGFLLMVFLHFFLALTDENIFWLPTLENNIIIRKFRNHHGGPILLAVGIGLVLIYYAEKDMQVDIAVSYLLGILIHEVIGLINSLFENDNINTVNIARDGLLGFIYLEIIDASFSFDGVVGAFAISTNIVVIMIGLGIGAMFVRSLTMLFVERNTLAKYIYLEHGAHYAIGFLSLVLLSKVFIEVPEWLTGSVSIIILLSSFIHSILKNKQSQNKIC